MLTGEVLVAKLLVPPSVIDLFGDETRVRSRITRAAFEELCSAEA
jgi:hypothetical protein